jgi:hypothetical protein
LWSIATVHGVCCWVHELESPGLLKDSRGFLKEFCGFLGDSPGFMKHSLEAIACSVLIMRTQLAPWEGNEEEARVSQGNGVTIEESNSTGQAAPLPHRRVQNTTFMICQPEWVEPGLESECSDALRSVGCTTRFFREVSARSGQRVIALDWVYRAHMGCIP